MAKTTKTSKKVANKKEAKTTSTTTNKVNYVTPEVIAKRAELMITRIRKAIEEKVKDPVEREKKKERLFVTSLKLASLITKRTAKILVNWVRKSKVLDVASVYAKQLRNE